MKKILKWVGIVILTLIFIAVVSIFVLINRMNGRLERTYQITVEKTTIPSDSASLERGKGFVADCQACHGEALEGKKFFDDPKLGTIYSPNLTRGEGGIGKTYSDEDWIRSVRHGVRPNGKALLVMPAEYFQNYSEKDLTCIIAYVKSVTPVDNKKGENRLPWLTKVLMQLGMFGIVFPAEEVKHEQGFPAEPKEGPTKEYGKYMVSVLGCMTCHGENYAGGKSPDPNSPPVPNLTPAGNLSKWSAKDFIQTLRTGITPEKKNMNDLYMPWKHIGQLSDERLTAIYHFLKSLPETPTPK